ncbi:hypothetical protein KA071_02220 [Candidatus Gracilibacteria bacterium]|nr:hypothetical protein [Candidatus Gracilibacteria bacterium]
MLRKLALPLLGVIAGIGLFFWWLSYWPAQVTLPDEGPDLLWRSIQKKENGWERGVYSASKKADFMSYQEGKVVLYGQGKQPKIETQEDGINIVLDNGAWIIRSLDQSQKISLKADSTNATITGVGGIFIDVDQKIVSNFDADLMLGGAKLLPAFLSRDGKQEFFDIGEQKELIPTDLWLVYATFFPRDQAKVLGNISKKFLDTMIRTLITREPASSEEGLFKRDVRVKNALDEIQSIIAKIDTGDNCGVDRSSCFTILSDILAREKIRFPEVFLPLEHAIQAWIQLDTDVQETGYSWANIFRTYHTQLLKGDARARVIRDKSILEMIKSGSTDSSLETWEYLTQMLASQKLGSAYSLQIVREMIRIGDILQRSNEIPEATRKALVTSAIQSLSNLKTILENTYFTKKEYWFVLRTDLVDSEGNAIKNQVFINDLQELIKHIDGSSLIQVSSQESGSELPTIRAQLVWFNCIFSRNEEYVTNPRICRTTKVETKK